MSDNVNEIRQVATIFAEKYNTHNGTHFAWINDKQCFEPGEPFDFVLYDDDNSSLSCQVTRVLTDEMREYIKPDKASKIISEVSKLLDSKGIRDLRVYINFCFFPTTADSIGELVWWLEYIIETKANEELASFSWDSEFDQYLAKIKPYVSNISIKRVDSPRVGFVFGTDSGKPEPWLGSDQTIPFAVFKKEDFYTKKGIDLGNIILVVISSTFPTLDSEYYVNEIMNKISQSKFKEIWLVDNYLTHRGAAKIK